MLRISQVGPPNEPTSDVLQDIINSLTFTS